ncbi:MAG: FG-GAP-like repeat-containing protein [Ignavibacteriaceae bacterium]
MNALCKSFLFVLCAMCIMNYTFGQGLFTQHAIDNSFNGACSVCSYDLDGDGNLDILAAGNSGHQIAWWKAQADTPLTFSKYIIDQTATGIIFVDAADIDDDNNLDILGASWQGNEVDVWLNYGGNPITWDKYTIDSTITQVHEVHGAYIDSDSLIDIIVASGGDNSIVWYQNTGGGPWGWLKNVVDDQFAGARSVVSYDLNNDGYNDLIGAALSVNQLSVWYNSGTNPVQWTKQIVDNTIGGAHWVHIVDLDNDNDPDIVAAGAIPGIIAWWRNDGGNPIQWTKQIIAGSFAGALSVAAADLDLDNDIDVFGAATNANRVSWWKNNGGEPIQWSTNSILSSYAGAWPVFGIDIDEDGDTDILTAASTGNKVTLLENTTIVTNSTNELSSAQKNFYLFQNYPNPFNPTTIISYQIPELSFVSLKVYGVLGNELATLVNEEKSAGNYEVEFNGTDLPSGIYVYKILAGFFSQTKKMILLK